jgi:hypothetical protein
VGSIWVQGMVAAFLDRFEKLEQGEEPKAWEHRINDVARS